MNELSTLWAQVLENTEDSTLRLIVADRLRESDDINEQTRGQLIWATQTILRMPSPFFAELAENEKKLYQGAINALAAVAESGYPNQWLIGLGLGSSELADHSHEIRGSVLSVRIRDSCVCEFWGGLLSSVVVGFEDWCRSAPAILAQWPIRDVHFYRQSELPFEERPHIYLNIRRANYVRSPWSLGLRFEMPRVVRTILVRRRFQTRQALVERIGTVSKEMLQALRQRVTVEWPEHANDW